jgi:hypothetical protein
MPPGRDLHDPDGPMSLAIVVDAFPSEQVWVTSDQRDLPGRALCGPRSDGTNVRFRNHMAARERPRWVAIGRNAQGGLLLIRLCVAEVSKQMSLSCARPDLGPFRRSALGQFSEIRRRFTLCNFLRIRANSELCGACPWMRYGIHCSANSLVLRECSRSACHYRGRDDVCRTSVAES